MTQPPLPAPGARWRDIAPARLLPDGDTAVGFARHVYARVPGPYALGGQFAGVPGAIYITPSGPELTTTLWLRHGDELDLNDPRDRDLRFAVAGPADRVTAETPRWEAIVNDALAAFRADAPAARAWTAFLGPDPAQGALRSHDLIWSDQLETPVTVGPLALSSPDAWVHTIEPSPHDRTLLYTVAFRPLQVSGSTVSFTGPGAAEAAAVQLDLLCQLLTLATGRVWTHWRTPEVLEHPDAADELADAWLRRASRLPHLPGRLPEPQALELPGWLPAAWDRLTAGTSASTTAAEALTAFDSAVGLLTSGRPSDAGARFQAVLEGFSRRARTAKERKEQALAHVASRLAALPGQRAEDFTDVAAAIAMTGRRDGTVHRGARYGSERRRNMPVRMLSINGDEAHTYEQRVETLHRLCQALLLEELAGIPVDPAPLLQRHQDLNDGVVIW
ncbi:hypothetical protein [Streptomyces filamentosus]|uniref:hypothetical protein n=1 Tax=Streptomyces filamentosus TaxID=67294 RepID=UPI0033C49600